MMAGPEERDARQRIPAGLVRRIVLPPIVGCALLAAYVAAEALGFHGLARPEADTISEAAALGHAARALELIAAGQDPNGRLHIRPGRLDSGEHDLRPLEAAILGRHAELVRLLQRSGATRTDAPQAACLARARLPEVLPDLGDSSTVSPDSPTDIETAIRICSAAR
jgi:hypothetical protein